MGLYIVGRSDAELKQLENFIIAEKRTHQLRVITADKLLTLAELLADYEMEHEAVLTVLRPTGPVLDSLIELMAGLVAKEIHTAGEGIQQSPRKKITNELSSELEGTDVQYYLAPVASDDTQTAKERIKNSLAQEFTPSAKIPWDEKLRSRATGFVFMPPRRAW